MDPRNSRLQAAKLKGVSTPLPGIASQPARFGLILRLGVIAAVLAVEALFASYLIQATPADSVSGAAEVVREVQHWLFRFIIAYAVSLAMLVYLRGALFSAVLAAADQAPVRMRWGIVHALLFVLFAFLSAVLYAGSPVVPFALTALAWHACAIAAVLALFAALAPLSVWAGLAKQTAGLPLFAILPAAAAVAAIKLSQMLWAPAAELTFRLVLILLRPLRPTIESDPVTLTLATNHFAVQIAEVCSGLEGVGLMLAFCTAWLWLFRREYYFPRALLVVPLGVLFVFLLNALRIAGLVLIGDAGYSRVAVVGFHSQAGWIGFNVAAFGVAILAHTSPWVSRAARARAAARRAGAVNAADTANTATATATVTVTVNPTAAYLMPLLIVLATGMIAHALSAGFEFLYPLRFAGALAALWFYRRSYTGVDFRCSWRAPLVGLAMFGVWWAVGSLMTLPAPEPDPLSSLPAPLRTTWIVCRVLAAVGTVPVVEELAYRGYLLRRLVSAHFESVPFSNARWPALTASALAFGITHGGLWLPGIAAGFAYGALAMRTNKLGESIVAHGTTNALLAAYVLLFDQWQLW
jgi:exosortase E/protease (VPEID-CTERM system)